MVPFQSETFGLNAHWYSKVEPLDRIHHHPEIEINYLKGGEIDYLFRWKQVTLIPDRFYLFWGSTPHRLIRGDAKAQIGWVTLPLPLIRQWNLPESFLQKLMSGDLLMESGSPPLSSRYSLPMWVDEIERQKKTHSVPLGLELGAFFHRFSDQYQVPILRRSGRSEYRFESHVEKMAQFMGRNFQEPIQGDAIAGYAGLHPKYAIRYFRKHCGVTPHQYLQQFRINYAQQLLISTSKKMIDISIESGFQSLSVFYRVFEEMTGMPPLRFKKLWSFSEDGKKNRTAKG